MKTKKPLLLAAFTLVLVALVVGIAGLALAATEAPDNHQAIPVVGTVEFSTWTGPAFPAPDASGNFVWPDQELTYNLHGDLEGTYVLTATWYGSVVSPDYTFEGQATFTGKVASRRTSWMTDVEGSGVMHDGYEFAGLQSWISTITSSAGPLSHMRGEITVQDRYGHGDGSDYTTYTGTLDLAAPSFSDAPTTHPYYEAISDIADLGIINGYPGGTFKPDKPVTRQQFAKMIVLTGDYPVSESDICAFTDVLKGDATTCYPDNFVSVCAAHGITTGKTATVFDPNSSISRYQAITMVVRAADDLLPGLLVAPPAGWKATGAWGNDDIHGPNAARAEYNGLLDGLNLAVLDPNGGMTRGQVAQVLDNLLTELSPTQAFRGSLNGECVFLPGSAVNLPDNPNPPYIYTISHAVGIASHLGEAVMDSHHPTPPADTIAGGKMTLTAANGDKLYIDYDGTAPPPTQGVPSTVVVTGTFDITGGTGRFANADGEAGYTAWIEFSGDMLSPLPWHGVWYWDGSISY
jgi:hypothetical protein